MADVGRLMAAPKTPHLALVRRKAGASLPVAPAPRLRVAPVAPLLLLVLVSLSGCFDPYAVHVDVNTLSKSSLGWQTTPFPPTDSGLLSTKQTQTDYNVASGQSAPPAHLEVYGLRSPADPGSATLLNRSREALFSYAQSKGLSIDHTKDRTGTRTIASGLDTTWFTAEGKATSSGLFTRNYKVRLVAEVGHDGRSSTSLLAVGVAQVQTSRQCPIIGECQPIDDERTWIEMVGDADGHIDGTVSRIGLLDHVVTH